MRLVSLCPSITETLVVFGRAKDLVGITRFCIHPKEAVAQIPKVGGTKDPKVERIIELRPDLVFLNEEENRKEDFDALLAAGVPVDATMTRRVDEVPGQLRHFGRRAAAKDRAEGFARRLEAELEALEAARAARARPFTFAYVIWREPWMVVGADTYVADLLARAGGENVFDAADARYPEVPLESIVGAKPDIVFLPDEPFPFKAAHVPELQARLPKSRIELVSGDDLCWHGVRSIRGAKLATHLARTL